MARSKRGTIIVNDANGGGVEHPAYIYDSGLAIYARPNGSTGRLWSIFHIASAAHVFSFRKLQSARTAVAKLEPLTDWKKALTVQQINSLKPITLRIKAEIVE